MWIRRDIFHPGGSKGGFGRLQPLLHLGNVLWVPVILIDSHRGWAHIAAHHPGQFLTSSRGARFVMTPLTQLSGVRTNPIGTLKNSRPNGIRLRNIRVRLLLLLAIIVGSSLLSSSLPQSVSLAPYHSITVYAAGDDFGVFNSDEHSVSAFVSAATQAPACRGKCLDPHPGAFRQWTGQKNGCWVQIWRSWPEGCQHYQWYNSCTSYWDSYPNGAPRVFWSCCVH